MSYIASYFHCIFATKDRRPIITTDLQQRLYPYIGGIARENQIKLLEVGGIADHIHLLLSLPPTMPISKALQLIKGASSKWIHDTFPEHRLFSWQDKYGAFTVSVSQLKTVASYIQSQQEHHRKRTFEEEFTAFLKIDQINYDPQYLWR
jgi:putative transposase